MDKKTLYLRGLPTETFKDFNHECIDLDMSQTELFVHIWQLYKNKRELNMEISYINDLRNKIPLYGKLLGHFNPDGDLKLEQYNLSKAAIIIDAVRIDDNTVTLNQINNHLLEYHNSKFESNSSMRFTNIELHSIDNKILNFFRDNGFEVINSNRNKTILGRKNN